MSNILWEPFTLAPDLVIKNRIVMAPLTRAFANEHLEPTKEVANYYAKRADCGLIISEATIVSPMAQGYPRTPGIYSDGQVEAWRHVTKAVHEHGGKIFLQLWHVGRVSHSFYLKGSKPLAPSPVGLKGKLRRLDQEELYYEVPQEMTREDIQNTLMEFRRAAKHAMQADFDGVEIHAANGYLIDQFLHQDSNRRLDDYGGSTVKRSRFVTEVIAEVLKEVSHTRVGIRLSPAAHLNMVHTPGDELTFTHVLKKIEESKLAYVHLGLFDDTQDHDYLNGKASNFLRKNYCGTLMACGNIRYQEAITGVQGEDYDLVAFGRDFIANPNLIEKLKNKEPLKPYDPKMLQSLD